METKTCKKCGAEKALTDFTVTDRHYGYRKAQCRPCEADRVRAYYLASEDRQEAARIRARGLGPKRRPQPRPEDYDEDVHTKPCTRCRRDLVLSAFSRQKGGAYGRLSVCKECKTAENREAVRTGRWVSFTPEYQRRERLKRLYGLSVEQYDAMLSAQNGQCALCETTEAGVKGVRHNTMVVDHCHATGKVRGLLCGSCNIWLGNLEELLRRAPLEKLLNYLFEPTPTEK